MTEEQEDVIAFTLLRIERKLDQIMTAQDDINAAVATVTALLNDISAQVTALATDLQTLTSELGAQGVDTTALNSVTAQVSGIQSALDQGVAGITSLATSNEPPPPTPPTPVPPTPAQ